MSQILVTYSTTVCNWILLLVPFTYCLSTAGGQSSATYTIFPSDYRVPFQKRKHIGIPTVLWEHFQCQSLPLSSRTRAHLSTQRPSLSVTWVFSLKLTGPGSHLTISSSFGIMSKGTFVSASQWIDTTNMYIDKS